jgi:hypothetical protein
VASRGRARPVLAALAAAAAALAAAGCVSMPSGGPVLSSPITQGTGAQNQPYVQIVPQPPGKGWPPQDVVKGFLTASASFGNHSAVAMDYLTPQEQRTWNPLWSAIVYKDGPNVTGPATPVAGAKDTVAVQITGQEQASLTGHGSYSVQSSSSSSGSSDAGQEFQLVRQGGQWRISSAPPTLLLTSDSFANDYQLSNLYFFDPTGKFLVPDPVYVPVQTGAEELMTGLVDDLITQPDDWLSGGATRTALPAGTKISGVTLDGVTAVVNLTGTIAKAGVSDAALQKVSAQLFWTLSTQSGTTGQPVRSVELELNGHPWAPLGAQDNPVQQQAAVSPPTGASSVFYYVDSAGYLVRRDGQQGTPERIEHLGRGVSQVAVSPDGAFLAVLRGTTLSTGLVHGPLTKRGGGFESMSFDPSDNLWVSGGTSIALFRSAPSSRQPLGQQVAVEVNEPVIDNASLPVSGLRVAPDGVRVAIITGTGSDELTFGAISGAAGPSPSIMLSQIAMTPLNATAFTGVTWYGPDHVITLASGPAATEYPVNGGSPTSIPVTPNMQTITASWKNILIAGMSEGKLGADVSLTGSWTRLGGGVAPAYPG